MTLCAEEFFFPVWAKSNSWNLLQMLVFHPRQPAALQEVTQGLSEQQNEPAFIRTAG